MSGIFGSTTIKGTRITDFAQSTATVGIVIPFGKGTFPVDGNVIFAPMPPKEHVTKKRQGKGGVKQEIFTYTLSYAIAFCKGPIYGYLWIKRNGKVVYTEDPNAPLEDRNYAAKWALKTTFYYGSKGQLPDSTIESYKGTGMVSAFRNLAYIVVEDDDVTDGGGAVPTYEACVVASPPEVYVTSAPYPLYVEDAIIPELSHRGGQFLEQMMDSIGPSLTHTGGTNRFILQSYTTVPESIAPYLTHTGGTNRQILVSYFNYAPEAIQPAVTHTGGTVVETLKTYLNYAPEAIQPALTHTGGTKT